MDLGEEQRLALVLGELVQRGERAGRRGGIGARGFVPSLVSCTRFRFLLRSSSRQVRWAMVYIQGIGLAPKT